VFWTERGIESMSLNPDTVVESRLRLACSRADFAAQGDVYSGQA
jgi:hypothetical protein